MQLLQAAADLVRGPYLADIDSAWADAERSQFEIDHLKNLIQLAELYLDTDQPDLTIKICQLILKTNRLLEEAYRLLIRAHSQRGDRSAAAEVYKKCSTILLRELGIRPDSETERIYRLLI